MILLMFYTLRLLITCSTTYCQKSLRTTIFRLSENDPQKWGLVQLSPRAIRPKWVEFETSTYEAGVEHVSRFFYTLRHTVGMTSVYFILVKHCDGTDFWLLQSHLFGEGMGKSLIQRQVARRYLEQLPNASKHAKALALPLSSSSTPPPWSRYVQAILSQDKVGPKAYWGRDFAPAKRLPSYMTTAPLREDVADRPVHAYSRPVTLDRLNLGRLSSEASVSIPVLVEAIFALAVGLYWGQHDLRGTNFAFYTKLVQSVLNFLPGLSRRL